MDIKAIKDKFNSLFGNELRVYASPGRVNLIGEHTDYNGGFVFPGAIDKGIYAAINPTGTDKIRAYSIDYQAIAEFGMREEDAPK
ncbi:MAG: galactokinase, partial [Bacteroidales bacterium]|nr:galactokinase [Bacteroidales bacterium]